MHAEEGDGCGKFREVLDGRLSTQAVPLSDWSRDVSRLLERQGVARPLMEHRVDDQDGSLIGVLDLAYPDKKVGIELDSVRWHLNRESFERDAARRTALSVAGWVILNFTWRHYRDDPIGLCRSVSRALAAAHTRNLGA